MNKKEQNTQLFSATMRQDGIVYVTWLPNMEIDLAAAKESLAAVDTLCQGNPHPLLFDMRSIKSIDREAREYYNGPSGSGMDAVALLIDSEVGRFIANVILRINKPTTPLQMFTSETEALKWLQRIT
jgi:hypothetical protein